MQKKKIPVPIMCNNVQYQFSSMNGAMNISQPNYSKRSVQLLFIIKYILLMKEMSIYQSISSFIFNLFFFLLFFWCHYCHYCHCSNHVIFFSMNSLNTLNLTHATYILLNLKCILITFYQDANKPVAMSHLLIAITYT